MELGVEAILKGARQVATLPTIYTRVNDAVENPESSFAEIGKIIGSDPALSARLLKIVNSPFYGFSSKIETITHAITIIGTAQLRDLVLATTVIEQFRGIEDESLNMKSFWMHSIACGLCARIIATFCQEKSTERYYVLGMLHDLGRLVMLISVPEKMKEAIEKSQAENVPLIDCEKEMIGHDHGEVGCALLRQWKLPPMIQEITLYCHNPSQAGPMEKDASLLHLADLITHAMEFGNSGDVSIPSLNTKAWNQLGLSTSMLTLIIQQLDRQLNETASMLL